MVKVKIILTVLSAMSVFPQKTASTEITDFRQVAILPAQIKEGKLVCENQYSVNSNSNALIIKSSPRLLMEIDSTNIDQIVSVIEVYSLNDLLIDRTIKQERSKACIENVLVISPVPREVIKIRTFGYMTQIPDTPYSGKKVVFTTTKLYESLFPAESFLE